MNILEVKRAMNKPDKYIIVTIDCNDARKFRNV